MCPQVDVHHHGFGSVSGDIDQCPLLEFVDGVLKLAEVKVAVFTSTVMAESSTYFQR